MADGIDGVLSQFDANGMPEPMLPLVTDGTKKVYGPKKKAWYRIREWTSPKSGRVYLFGNYGYKADHWELEAEAPDWTPEERRQFAQARADAERRDRERREEAAQRAAERAQHQFARAVRDGVEQHPYLQRKGVPAEACRVMTDRGWEGWLIVPLLRYDSVPARLVGAQKIAPQKLADGIDKLFNKGMDKVGAACRLGPEPEDGAPILLAEGYATAMSVRLSLDLRLTAYMAIDAGNLPHVARILRQRFPRSPILFCADDDYLTGEKGRTEAEAAARAVGRSAVVLPRFSVARATVKDDPKVPYLTDFNDLQQTEGLAVVASQVEAALQALLDQPVLDAEPASPAPPSFGDSPEVGVPRTLDALRRHCMLVYGKTDVWDSLSQTRMKWGAFQAAVGKQLAQAWRDGEPVPKQIRESDLPSRRRGAAQEGGAGEGGPLVEMLKRYTLLYGTETVWDAELRRVVGLGALRAMWTPDMVTLWQGNPARQWINADNLVFDPTMRVDPKTHINMFNGLPLVPMADPSKCAAILDMVANLFDFDGIEAYDWFMKWLAYPLQNPGAKMATTVLMYGEAQGTGKSWTFDGVVSAIYGEYATTAGQHQLESSFTDWRSRKLFVVFEEVLSKQDRYNHLGTIKHMVTGRTQRINPKGLPEREENNHLNCGFLSNEPQPIPVEMEDRRFLVVWANRRMLDEERDAVSREIAHGGIEAFYHLLLHYPLGDFGPHTKPPMTPAKLRLIEYGLPGWQVFYQEWRGGLLDAPYLSCGTLDLFKVYRRWCERHGEKALTHTKFSTMLGSRERKAVERPGFGMAVKQKTMFVIGAPPEGKTKGAWLGDCDDEFQRKAGLRTVADVDPFE